MLSRSHAEDPRKLVGHANNSRDILGMGEVYCRVTLGLSHCLHCHPLPSVYLGVKTRRLLQLHPHISMRDACASGLIHV